MSDKKILMFSPTLSEQGEAITIAFATDIISEASAIADNLSVYSYQVMVIDLVGLSVDSISEYVSGLVSPKEIDVPIVVLAEVSSLDDKVEIYDVGVDDLIDQTVSNDEVIARCRKAMYHTIAMQQISSQLTTAAETARNAIVDKDDLDANVKFLLDLNDCDNLDQVGQLFFRTIQRYGLSCSLQLRSLMDIKNMEPTGMSKDLVAQLLTQLKDDGLFLDLGRRTIINYERVSLLVKNMPTENFEKYATAKKNVFALVQGVNSCVVALEDRYLLEQEKRSVERLSHDVYSVIGLIKGSYQQVMRDIAHKVDVTAEKIQMKIPALSLAEADEQYLDDVIQDCIIDTTKIFNEGLKVNDIFEGLELSVKDALDIIEKKADDRLVSKHRKEGEE